LFVDSLKILAIAGIIVIAVAVIFAAQGYHNNIMNSLFRDGKKFSAETLPILSPKQSVNLF